MEYNEEKVGKFLNENRVIRTEIVTQYKSVIKTYLEWEQKQGQTLPLDSVVGSATSNAATTINFLSAFIHGIENGKSSNLVIMDLENAKYHFNALMKEFEL